MSTVQYTFVCLLDVAGGMIFYDMVVGGIPQILPPPFRLGYSINPGREGVFEFEFFEREKG
jgi:hypothetical protein